MKKTLTIFLVCLSTSPLFSQNELNKFTILMGGSVGIFLMDGGSGFENYYTDTKLAPTGIFGLGNGETFVVGKYRIFKASGKSKLDNLTADGKASWKQTTISGGFHYHPGGHPLYVEALLVSTTAEESITTENPQVDVLSASEKLDDMGFAFSLGLAPRFVGPLALSLEVEYSFMLRKPVNENGRRIPNVGGLCYSAGLVLYFNN